MGGLADLTLPLFSTMETWRTATASARGGAGARDRGSHNDFTGHGFPMPTKLNPVERKNESSIA